MATKTDAPIAEPETGPVSERLHRWQENRPATGWNPFDLREVWAYRELAASFVLKDLKVRYKQTFFGVAWAVMQPLAAVLVFTIVFGRLAGLPADGLPYVVFVYAGVTLWLYFASSVSAAAQSLVDNRDLVSKVYFPRILAPGAAVVSPLLDLAISLGILAVFLGAYRIAPGPEIALLPLWIAAAVAVAFATGLWLSALNVKYRDVKHVLGFVTQIWLFASPVVYSSSLVEGNWRYLYAANPIATVLDGFRWSLAGAPAPGPEALVSLAVGLAVLVGGAAYFSRVETSFADLI